MDKPIRILSWNINGIRTQKNNFKQFLDSLQADLVCLQETKITRDQLEEDIALVDGYHSFFSFSRKRTGYSGVATFCKKESTPGYAQEGLGGSLDVGSLRNECGQPESLIGNWNTKDLKELDYEGRCIISQHSFQANNGFKIDVAIFNVYCPRADPEKPERAEFKLQFYELLRQRAHVLRAAGSHVLILGDINTAHKRIDRCDSDEDEEFENRPDRIFLNEFLVDPSSSNAALTGSPTGKLTASDGGKETEDEILAVTRVIDTFRAFHPDQRDSFTCWNTRINARATNYGSRIDYILCNEEFLPFIQDSNIHPDILGSDHCPVSVALKNLRWLPSQSIPQMATKFYPEFVGNQQKLSSYFKANTDSITCSPENINFNNSINKNSSQNSSTLITVNKEKDQNSKRKLRGKIDKNAKKKINTGSGKQLTLNNYFIGRHPEDIAKGGSGIGCFDSNSDSPVGLNTDSATLGLLSTVSASSSQNSLMSDYVDEIPEKLHNTDIIVSDDVVNSPTIKCFNDIVTEDSGANIKLSEEKSTRDRCSSEWNFLMKGPAPPPVCSGHKEPSVLRTVKKKGPNLNKQFYSCARGFGKEGDPNATCKFFQWVGKKPKFKF